MGLVVTRIDGSAIVVCRVTRCSGAAKVMLYGEMLS